MGVVLSGFDGGALVGALEGGALAGGVLCCFCGVDMAAVLYICRSLLFLSLYNISQGR